MLWVVNPSSSTRFGSCSFPSCPGLPQNLLSKKSKSVIVFSEYSKEPILGPLSIHQTTKILGVYKDIERPTLTPGLE